MCDRQHRESLSPSLNCTASARRQTDAVEPRMQDEELARNEKKISVGICTDYRNVSANF